MAILRHHHEKDFTIIPNSIFRDDRLNMKDIGLLCFMLHLPDGWDFSIHGLQSVLPNDGRDSISASLKRIEQAGYLHREQERNKNGTLADYMWTVSDVPMEPKTENPNTENPTQRKNIVNKEQNKGFPMENKRIYKGLPVATASTVSFGGIDFSVFAGIARSEYETVCQGTKYPYTFGDVLAVFRTFFAAYEQRRGEQHPPIKREQIRSLIERLPYSDDITCGDWNIDPDEYQSIIEAYFDTNFKNCDYRISHFMAGDIRQMRIYETAY